MARAKREAHHVDEVEIAENVKAKFKGDKAKQKQVFVFATTFNNLLESRGIDQGKLADEIGVSSGCVSNYRNGRQEPSLCNLIAIADYLGVDCHYLMTGVQQGNIKTARKTGLSDDAISRLHRIKSRVDIEHKNGWRGLPEEMELAAINLLLESDTSVLLNIYQYVYGGFDSFFMDVLDDDGNDKEVVSGCVGVRSQGCNDILIKADKLQQVFLLDIQDGLRKLKDRIRGGANNGVHKAKD